MNINSIDKKNLREILLFLIMKIQNGSKISLEIKKLKEKKYLDDSKFGFLESFLRKFFNRIISIDFILKNLIGNKFKKMPIIIINTIRIAIYDLVYSEKEIKEFTIVNESVKITKKFSHKGLGNLVNAVLRNLIRKKDKIITILENESKSQYLEFKYSLPKWLVEYWLENMNYDEVEILAKDLLLEKNLFLRINTLKISTDEFKNELNNRNIAFSETVIDECIYLNNKVIIEDLYGYEEGFWYIQDLSSSIVSIVLEPNENSTVIDFCSFPGGKSTHCSQLMKNEGKVIAVDNSKKKQPMMQENINRLGNKNISIKISSALEKIDLELADKIIVDPSCSSLGLISKKPEIKFHKNKLDIERLSKLQIQILNNASEYLKTNGDLIYSTCTISYLENEYVINKFLEKNKNFSLENIEVGDYNNKYFKIMPNYFNSNPFFIAKLRRNS